MDNRIGDRCAKKKVQKRKGKDTLALFSFAKYISLLEQ